jgi:voltage-gated potassium channel
VTEQTLREDLKSTPYEFFILAVSILSIVNLVLYAVLSSKRHYLVKAGGIFDFLGCLPALRIFRLFRIVRAGRIIRRLGGPRVFRELRSGLASGTLYFVVFFGIFTLEFVGLLELYFEEDAAGANITTAGDALWWAYVTATTVGYGDQYPVTHGGRLVGLLMLTVGVALFATFSGFLANMFLRARQPRGAEEPAKREAALGDVQQLLSEQERVTAELRARIGELEVGA